MLALTIIAAGCAESKPVASIADETHVVKQYRPANDCFTLGIEQHGRRIPIDPTRCVNLDKAPFRLVFYFRDYGDMLVSASFAPRLVRRARDGEGIDRLLLPGACIAEEFKNPEGLLCIRNRGEYQNWMCLGSDDHRFDNSEGVKSIPEGYESGYLCRRTIKNLDVKGSTFEIERCPSDVIYMLFVRTDEKQGGDRAERQREWLEIRFSQSPALVMNR
jgi:hypothetical protein